MDEPGPRCLLMLDQLVTWALAIGREEHEQACAGGEGGVRGRRSMSVAGSLEGGTWI